jgi:hypothetical protein
MRETYDKKVDNKLFFVIIFVTSQEFGEREMWMTQFEGSNHDPNEHYSENSKFEIGIVGRINAVII